MIKNILNFPFMYQLLQTICLTENFRKNVITEKIKSDNQIILDIGCDPGNMIKYLKFVNYYGFDSDKNYIDYAKNKYKECSFFLEEFSLKSTKKIEKVDTVLLSGLLHHLSDDEIKELMSAIKLSVKKKFQIIILDPVIYEKQNSIARFLIKNDRGKFVRDEIGYLKLFKEFQLNYKHKIHHQKIVPYTWIVSEITSFN